ncbi:DUF6474 family protein [Corynebacterium sp. 153RC1]|uniref:DUF6474 family protein n=1 Tax=unclassified Corynebacterium TaxID=2624378 RepID=UPI00211C55E9|nr:MULTISPECIES: DUF6474 family protein [unclassified Corynebacterium]MCQ9353265.1 DUF6474 family protein [Corynebacterium sp. 209RC1]MCQ9355405.1 DUF6474 family protein [Corynebacterium sp. 1222RC1]MCQ9357628.1 DUF6474 family protein [Corynebacterium sp. 122RC1]MCQ9359773.1 DUF6474 family protein [Corynebacterium sp. 142RC1]MCQ9361906.1 DUF6474 family protein [Corynebacterium sp. 153RC1]
MGIFKAIRNARIDAKAKIKAAEAQARQEVKEAHKLELRRTKLLTKAEKRVSKEEAKGLKRKRKHDEKMAKELTQQMRAGKFNKDTVMRYSGAARAIAPLALPLAFRGLMAIREYLNGRRANALGVSRADLGRFAGHGAEQKARIEAMRSSLKVTNLPQGFKEDAKDRLEELEDSANNAEYMTPELRTRALRAISADLDQIAKQIQQKRQKQI